MQNDRILSEVKDYEWRGKTEFPIIKIVGLSLSKVVEDKTLIEIEMERYVHRLHDLNNIALFKILYLLKESIIAY